MRLSILVVSRTARLLNRMLKSLASATNLNGIGVEILCSWNGSQEEEQAIKNTSGYELLIAQKDPYHFASNMNSLAEKANGELLLIINDDVILDPGSIDWAIQCLESSPDVGLVGARLRDGEGLLTHAGILFDSRHSPYHQLDRQVAAEHHLVMGTPRPVPAVTGALMLIRRDHFASLCFIHAPLPCPRIPYTIEAGGPALSTTAKFHPPRGGQDSATEGNGEGEEGQERRGREEERRRRGRDD